MSDVIYDDVMGTETLDREESMEMTVVIYKRSDLARNHKRQQELPHSGSVSVKNRSHRAVQVCLGLLCVLLLVAGIVFCVYFTTEEKHLPTHNYNLTKEREKLLSENTEIINQNKNLTKEREKLLSENTEIINQNKNLTKERENLLSENTEIINQNKNLTKERENLLSENTEIINQNKNLTKERENLLSENTEIINQNKNLTKGREKNTNKTDEQNILQDWSSKNVTWIYYNLTFYYISSEIKSWRESREDCKKRGADLVMINSKEEQEFLQNFTDRYYTGGHYSSSYWIGLINDGVWKWVDETTLTAGLWVYEYPNDNNYLAVTSTSGWTHQSCDRTHRWICEKSF